MARRDTPERAVRRYLAQMEVALGCIAPERLSIVRSSAIQLDRIYPAVLNSGDPVMLRSVPRIRFSAGRLYRVIEPQQRGRRFDVQTVQYWYEIADAEDRELLTFHWSPEAERAGEVIYPHLHVGSASISEKAPLMPGTFNKLHIPTGEVSLASLVRFLIEELGVRPLRNDWSSILRDEDADHNAAASPRLQ